MFKELHPLIRRTTLHMLLTSEGDLLRLNITPKAIDGENPALATPISLLATPEELDAELATILSSYTDAHMDLRASLNTAIAQITEAKAGAKPAKKPDVKKPAAKAKDATAVPADTATPTGTEMPAAAEPGADTAEGSTSGELQEPEQPAELTAEIPPSTPIEAAPPAGTEPEQVVEIPEQPPENPEQPATEKDTNTIELF